MDYSLLVGVHNHSVAVGALHLNQQGIHIGDSEFLAESVSRPLESPTAPTPPPPPRTRGGGAPAISMGTSVGPARAHASTSMTAAEVTPNGVDSDPRSQSTSDSHPTRPTDARGPQLAGRCAALLHGCDRYAAGLEHEQTNRAPRQDSPQGSAVIYRYISLTELHTERLAMIVLKATHARSFHASPIPNTSRQLGPHPAQPATLRRPSILQSRVTICNGTRPPILLPQSPPSPSPVRGGCRNAACQAHLLACGAARARCGPPTLPCVCRAAGARM